MAKTYYLDTYDPGADPYSGPRKTQRLAKRVPYKTAVSGTFSLFSAQELASPFCGTSEPRPMFPTKRRPNGPVIGDAEFLFADVSRNCAKRNNNPLTGTTFEIRVGNKFKNRVPIGGVGEAPRANHLYTYAVVGKGKFARFRLYDQFTMDNYGRLRIAISRATAIDCANNGFLNWKYASEAACVVATTRAIPR
jgi:hypothetical protein